MLTGALFVDETKIEKGVNIISKNGQMGNNQQNVKHFFSNNTRFFVCGERV
jgi:hypothetical protein